MLEHEERRLKRLWAAICGPLERLSRRGPRGKTRFRGERVYAPDFTQFRSVIIYVSGTARIAHHVQSASRTILLSSFSEGADPILESLDVSFYNRGIRDAGVYGPGFVVNEAGTISHLAVHALDVCICDISQYFKSLR